MALAHLLRRRPGSRETSRIAAAGGRILLCTGALAVVSALLWRAFEGVAARAFWQALLVLLLTLAAGAVTDAGTARLLRLEELGLVGRVLRRKRSAAVSSGRTG
jgi:hypothetical protein